MLPKLFRRNCCDGIYNSFDVHFTNFCDNKCAHCVDRGAEFVGDGRPEWEKMADAIIANQKGFDDVLILGGEPCLFLREMLDFICAIKDNTKLKVYCTSAVPKTCRDDTTRFFRILELLDGFNISAQHHDETVADQIRGVKSTFDRQEFYRRIAILHGPKVRINLNVVRGLLDTRKDITACLLHYDAMGFGSFKLSEIQHSTGDYRSFESIFGIKLASPYYGGCQTPIDTEKVLGVKLRAPLLLKRSCFLCESTLRASFMDGVKLIYKMLMRKPIIDNTNFGVVYEDGSIAKGWRKGVSHESR